LQFSAILIFFYRVGITNVTLFNVNLLLFQFVRALVIPFSILITLYLNGTLPSFKAGIACSFVVIGFFIGALTDSDQSSSWSGIAFGVLSSFVCAIYGVQVKRALSILGDDTFKTLYYNTIWGIIILFPFILAFEGSLALSELQTLFNSTKDMSCFLLTAVMGFMISISYVLNIRCSTPLTSHIVGSSKSALQSILVLAIPAFNPNYSNPNNSLQNSTLNKLGLFVVMAASLSYSYIQYAAPKSKPSSSPQHIK
jgi:drug/metabolite transporter (DMT)-like permease